MKDSIKANVFVEQIDGEETFRRALTLEELKAEAYRQGYELVRRSYYVPHLNCTCGRKPSMWYSNGSYMLQCPYCDKHSLFATTINKAWKSWNNEVCNK